MLVTAAAAGAPFSAPVLATAATDYISHCATPEPPRPAARLLGDQLRIEALELLSGAAMKAMEELPAALPGGDAKGGSPEVPQSLAPLSCEQSSGMDSASAAHQQRNQDAEPVALVGGLRQESAQHNATESRLSIAAPKALSIHLCSLLRIIDELLPMVRWTVPTWRLSAPSYL